jgi:hypothetical protein
MMEKEKELIKIITIPMEDAVVLVRAILATEDMGNDHLKNVECFNCGKKGQYYTDFSLPRKNDNEQSNMVSKSDFKTMFQSSFKEMLTKKDKQGKKNTEGDDDYLDMNVFFKLMEGKHTLIVTKSNDDLISINETDTFYYSMQDKITHRNY